MDKTLDRKLAAIHADPHGCREFILADAKGNILFRTTDPYGVQAGRINDPDSLRQLLAVQRPLVGHVVRGQRGRVACLRPRE